MNIIHWVFFRFFPGVGPSTAAEFACFVNLKSVVKNDLSLKSIVSNAGNILGAIQEDINVLDVLKTELNIKSEVC